MRAFLGIVFGLLAIAVIAIVTLPFVISTGWIREQVTEAVREHTGRDLIIAGDTSLSVFPSIALVVTHATLSNPPGREGAVANMEELDLGLKLMPLLSGRVEVDHFIVSRPLISLELDETGAANWTFAAQGSAEPEKRDPDGALPGDAAIAGAPLPATSPVETLPAFESLQIGDMRIVDGVITFTDRPRGTYQEFRDINASVELTSLDNPLAIEGTAVWQGEQVGLRLDLAEPRALATGTPSSVTATLESAHVRAGFTGAVTTKEGIDAAGDIEISTPSLKALARWLGAQPPRVDGLGAFSMTATMKAGKGEIALSSTQLTLDGVSAEGGGLVSFAGKRTLIQATLATDQIDVNRYLGEKAGKRDAPATPRDARANSGANAGGGGGVGGNRVPPDWDSEPINVDALQAIDADLRLSTRALLFRDIKAGQSALAVTLRDSILTIDLSELQLYEGRAAGKVTINGAGETPALAASFTVNNVAARQLLSDAVDLKWLQGRAQISGSLSSRGLTERRLVSALNGEVAVRFTDGAIRGFNIAQMARNLQGGEVFDWSREDAQQTDFSEFSANFTIAKGIAQTNNIQLLGPLVRLSGVGVANLPQRTVDFRINPKLVASIEGQGGAGDLTGIEVPFMIRGSWDSPTITPDLAAVLENPEQAINTIEQIGRSLDELRKGGSLEEAVGKVTKRKPKEFLELLMGGGNTAQGGGDPQAPPPIPEDVFNQLLGR